MRPSPNRKLRKNWRYSSVLQCLPRLCEGLNSTHSMGEKNYFPNYIFYRPISYIYIYQQINILCIYQELIRVKRIKTCMILIFLMPEHAISFHFLTLIFMFFQISGLLILYSFMMVIVNKLFLLHFR